MNLGGGGAAYFSPTRVCRLNLSQTVVPERQNPGTNEPAAVTDASDLSSSALVQTVHSSGKSAVKGSHQVLIHSRCAEDRRIAQRLSRSAVNSKMTPNHDKHPPHTAQEN